MCTPADATLSFELAEKVLRDRLRWLVASGAGLKALLTSALAHSLRAAADMGEEGHAAGGTTAGQLRAPMEELLTPFPQHVLVSNHHVLRLLRTTIMTILQLSFCFVGHAFFPGAIR
jgi:hypothetical protein